MRTVNADLSRISDWSHSYGLMVNPKKTQVIIVGSPGYISRIDFDQLPPVIFDGVHIPYSEKVKNLGIIFDKTFTWKPQVAEVSRKMFAAYYSLNRLRNLLPTSTKISLAQSLLLPILDYADSSYPDLTEEMLNKLERLQNLCIRFIFGLRKYDHVSSFRIRLKWLPIRHRRNYHILSLLYSILFNPSTPSYLKERFEFQSTTLNRTLRPSRHLSLTLPSHTSKFYAFSYTVQAIKLWNSLPAPLRQAPSLDSFKVRLKAHLLSLPV